MNKKIGNGVIKMPKHHLHFSGVPLEQEANEGIGIVLSQKEHKIVSRVVPISSRIIGTEMEQNGKISLIQIYTLTEGFKEEEVETFYTDLQESIDGIKEYNEGIIITEE